MKLVLQKKPEDGIWRIVGAREGSVEAPPSPQKGLHSPAKFLNRPVPPGTMPAAPSTPSEAERSPPPWAEPRASAAESPQMSPPKSPAALAANFASPAAANGDEARPRRYKSPRDAQESSGKSLGSTSRDRPSRPSVAGRGASPPTSTNGRASLSDGGKRSRRISGSQATNGSLRGSSARAKSPGSSGSNVRGRSPSNTVQRCGAGDNTEAPAVSRSFGRGNSEAEKLKELIRGVYQRKNPTKLAELEELLEKHRGDEKGVYEHVCRKYGETPRPWSAKAQ